MKNIKQILLIFLAYYGITCFSNVYFIFGPFYEKMGASPQETGLFLSVFYFVMLICRPLGSKVMEKFDIRLALIGSAAACAAASVGIALTLHSAPLVLFFRALTGLCASVFAVAAVAAQSLLLDEKHRGFGFALFTTGSLLPMATIVPLCDWMLRNGYDTLYLWTPALTAFVCLAVCWKVEDISGARLRESCAAAEEKQWGSYSDLFHVKGFAVLLATTLVMAIADGMTLSVASLAQERILSVSWYMIASAVAGVVIRSVAYKLIAKVPRKDLAAPAAAVIGLGLIGVSFSTSGTAFTMFGAVTGLGIGIAFPTVLALVGDMLPHGCRPKATGLVLLMTDAGWMLSPLLFGFFSPAVGASWTFRLIGAAVLLLSTLMYWQFWRKYRCAHATVVDA